MSELSGLQFVDGLLFLLPGFITAEIIAHLVVREDQNAIDRMVQAMVYTFLCHALWRFVTWVVPSIAPIQFFGLGICAVAWGFVLTILINSDVLHAKLRRMRLTQATSTRSVWYEAFYRVKAYIIVHLHDGRRLFGWPQMFPGRPDKGHFYLTDAEWLDRLDSDNLPPKRVNFLLDVQDVKFVEFLPFKGESNRHV